MRTAITLTAATAMVLRVVSFAVAYLVGAAIGAVLVIGVFAVAGDNGWLLAVGMLVPYTVVAVAVRLCRKRPAPVSEDAGWLDPHETWLAGGQLTDADVRDRFDAMIAAEWTEKSR
jgi:hypothetical protein